MNWLANLGQIDWTPSLGVISLIWTLLYPLIAIGDGFVLVQVARRRLPLSTALPVMLNLIFNALFSYFQEGSGHPIFASIDIFLVLVTVIWSISVIWPRYRWVGLAQIPYLLWVALATLLQFQIVLANR